MSQNFTLCSPCRISARELCELNEEGDWRIASWIRLVTWSRLIGRSLPRAYWVRRLRAMSRKRLLVMAAFLGGDFVCPDLIGRVGPDSRHPWEQSFRRGGCNAAFRSWLRRGRGPSAGRFRLRRTARCAPGRRP